MIDATGSYGAHLKPPNYHELRVTLLKKELDYRKGLLQVHAEERIKYGCSIMSDGWTDRKNRTLINFLINCSLGTKFVKSVLLNLWRPMTRSFDLLNGFGKKIGEKNAIQAVTDNGGNYKLVGKNSIIVNEAFNFIVITFDCYFAHKVSWFWSI